MPCEGSVDNDRAEHGMVGGKDILNNINVCSD